MKQNHQKSWAMAYCGIVAALCVALMLLGAVIPIAMFIAPAVAGFLVATVCVECGMQLALTAYAAVSLLALLFVPDKEVALIFVFLLGITRWQSQSLSASALRFCALSASCCCATAQCWPCTGWYFCWCRQAAFRRSCAPPRWLSRWQRWSWAMLPLCCTTGHCITCS